MRVIISLTTIPSRARTTLPKTIESLLAQTVKPYSIELHCSPVVYAGKQRPPRVVVDGKTTDTVLFDGQEVAECWHPKDHGPIMKLMSVVDPSTHADDLIVTVDDDIVYKPTWLATIIEAANKHPNEAIGFSGWNVGGFLAGGDDFQWSTPPAYVDVLEGWSGAAYRRPFFEGVDILNAPPAFKFVDDVWISSVLHRRGIKRRTIGNPWVLCSPATEGDDGLHGRHDFKEMNRLAVIEGFS